METPESSATTSALLGQALKSAWDAADHLTRIDHPAAPKLVRLATDLMSLCRALIREPRPPNPDE